ncbi:ABC transporter substrate-binding protein [Paenibacillus sp. S-38]|uniref:ABC transporter substrate-binding protein n=1 Tax=Paenibacillus sp. S-38 TaxID=3416710 RepID=UPI003CE8E8D0
MKSNYLTALRTGLAAAIGVTSLLAGCSSQGEAPENTQAAAPQGEVKPLGKFDPPIEVTAIANADEQKFFDGDTLQNNPHTRWALEKFGMKINYSIQPASGDQLKQKLQLMLASGEKLPDIINYYNDPVMVGQLIDSGQFIEVEELYNQYAGRIYKDHAEQHPEFWYPFMKDGKKYGIPLLEYQRNNEPVLWLREDWMKKLNLPAPKTLVDLEAVMDKFKNENPDGIPAGEVTPLVIALKNGGHGWMATVDWLFGAYGSVHEQWNKKSDGTLEYGSVHPGAKKALGKLSEWMGKGYISRDAGMMEEVKASELIIAGKSGVVVGPNWMPDWPFPDVLKNAPQAEWKAYPIPAGPDGTIGTLGDDAGSNGVILINKDFKHPEAFWLYYNYLLDHYANPQSGGEFEHGFAKGYDWDILDGQPTNDKSKLPKATTNFNFLTGISRNPARIPSLYFDTLVKLAEGKEAVTPYEKLTKQTRKPENWHAAKVVLDQKDIRKPNYFNGAPTETMREKWDLLMQSELETFNKIIYGKESEAAFDAFVEKWKKNGGDQITKEVNEWYRSVSGK